jgi:hypothetical protein
LILEQVGKRGATFNGIVLARAPPENHPVNGHGVFCLCSFAHHLNG